MLPHYPFFLSLSLSRLCLARGQNESYRNCIAKLIHLGMDKLSPTEATLSQVPIPFAISLLYP